MASRLWMFVMCSSMIGPSNIFSASRIAST